METQGAQIFHKLAPHLNPNILRKVLNGRHRLRIDKSKKDKSRPIHIQHPSPCSFGCIDLVFSITKDWSPFFDESVSVHLNRLTQLLVKAFIIYCLFGVCDYLPSIVDNHKNALKQLILGNEGKKSTRETRDEYIREISKMYGQRFSTLNIYEILMNIGKSFETCIRWYLALGFVPVKLPDDHFYNVKDLYKCTLELLKKCRYKQDGIQEFFAAYFTVLEFSMKNYDILSPYFVKHNVVITSRDGWYNATTYEGNDIELLSFDDIQPDCTSVRISLAASMLSHEYLYLFAHDTNAIQTTRKLCQSTIVVSSEPSFSINTKNKKNDENKNTLASGITAITELQSLYSKLSNDSKRELEYNPAALSVLDSDVPTRQQIRVLQDMYDQFKDRALTETIDISVEEDADNFTSVSNSIIDINENPQTNSLKSFETVQDIEKRTHLKEMQSNLQSAVKNIATLKHKLQKHIETSATDKLLISVLKLEKDEDKKNMVDKDKEISKLIKKNEDLLRRINNMVGVIKNITAHATTTQEENNEFLNVIMKGKSLTDEVQNEDVDLAWNLTPEKQTEVVNLFLNFLNLGEGKDENNVEINICEQFENVLLGLKMEIVPLFHKVQCKQQLDLFNSWIPLYMRDKWSSMIKENKTQTEFLDDKNNLIEIYETHSLKVIDVNPITRQERERVKKIAESTPDGSIIGTTGAGGSLFTKKFFNIQFPQTGNVEAAIDKGLREMWSQMIKTIFMIGAPMYTVTGQEIMPGPSQGTYEKFIIPFLTMILGTKEYILQTVALLMKIENTQMFEHGAKDLNTFLFDDIFYFFWDNLL